MEKLPDKLYFKIGEVSRITGLPSYVLRFWETEFKNIHPKRTNAGQRLYRKSDVELILKIKQLLYQKKFTIKGAKQHLKKYKSKALSPSEATGSMEEIRRELLEIRKILAS